MNVVICQSCKQLFLPKPMGFNARYCSRRCKSRHRYRVMREKHPDKVVIARAKSYMRIKDVPASLEKHRAEGRRYRQYGREWLAEFKLSQGCADCGYNKHAAALQLDHTGPKSMSIADARSSIRRLKDEIERGKCVVRCANCHAIKTAARRAERVGRAAAAAENRPVEMRTLGGGNG